MGDQERGGGHERCHQVKGGRMCRARETGKAKQRAENRYVMHAQQHPEISRSPG